jgi:hypothetical protein
LPAARPPKSCKERVEATNEKASHTAASSKVEGWKFNTAKIEHKQREIMTIEQSAV